jgi:RNA polymerase sigma-70 factor (ECF subfamily)
VLLAAHGSGENALKAQEVLCAAYWPPIYSFLRRKGYRPHDAEDLTQQFFARILGSNAFSRADRSKGRFRSFLLGSLKHFLVDEWRKTATLKRQGEIPAAMIDLSGAEEGYLQEPDPNLTPEQVYDRHWAATLLDLAFEKLRKDFVAAQQLDRFEILKTYLSEEAPRGEYKERAKLLGMTGNALRVAVARLRERYRQLVREVVADTLTDSKDVERELHELFR